jgi:hypothetical protein
MHKIAFMLLISLPLFAGFFPQTVHTFISNGNKKSISIAKPFPVNGMSGIIIHKYGNDYKAITRRIVQKSPGKIRFLNKNIIHHDELPTIKTPIFAKDEVIGGYLYDNVLLLAPDANTYKKITSSYDKKWIHPDIFALYLSSIGDNVPTKKNLKSFAQTYEIGLILIVTKKSAKLLDPLSGYIVGIQTISGLPQKGESPFFMRFDEIESGLFSLSNKEGYYSIMEKL